MADTTLPGLLATGDHASRPAASAVGTGALYSCTDHDLVYQSDGATWSTWATLGGTGLADQGAFTYLDATEAAAPSTPASGKVRVYAKSDGRIYSKDDAGTEYGPFDAAGAGGGPLLYVDDIALHADGDDFGSGMGGWTTGGSPSASSTVTTEPYDDTCIDLTFPSQSDRYYKAIDSGDWTYYLTVHGISNSTPSPDAALDAMIALVATDNSGNGTGFSLYGNPDGWYLWAVSGNAYSSTAASSSTAFQTVCAAKAANWPIVYRLRKVSTTIYGAVSFNGGLTWFELSRTDSTTFTRIGITRLFNVGGTNPTLRLGRFNLVP